MISIAQGKITLFRTVCIATLTTLLLLSTQVAAQIEEAPSSDLLKQLGADDLAERRDAAYELVRRQDTSESVLRGLAKIANERDEQLQFQALMGLGRAGEAAEVAIPELLQTLRDRSDQVRYRASIALGNIGSASVSPMLKYWPKASREGKEDLARAFGLIGPPAGQALPLLKDAMSSGEERMQRLSAEAISKIVSGEQAVDSLLELAEHPSSTIRRVGLQALSNIQSPTPQVLEKFRNALRDDDPQVRETALIAAAKADLSDAEKRAVLLDSLVDKDAIVRAAARSRIRKSGFKASELTPSILASIQSLDVEQAESATTLFATVCDLGLTDIAQTEALLDEAIRLDANPGAIAKDFARLDSSAFRRMIELIQTRSEFEPIVSATLSNAGASAIEVLLDGLNSELPVVQVASIRALGDVAEQSKNVSDESVVQRLGQMLSSETPDVRAASLHSLAQMLAASEDAAKFATPELIQKIVTATEDKAAMVRAAVFIDLLRFQIPTAESKRLILIGLADQELPVRVATLESLAKSPSLTLELLGPIQKLTQSPEASLRARAFETIARIAPSEVEKLKLMDTLVPGLQDENSQVQIAATNCIARLKLGDDQVVELLGQNLNNDTELLKASLEAIGEIGERASSLAPTVDNLLGHSNEPARLLAVNALSKIQSDSKMLTSSLTECLSDDSWLVRQRAAETLGRMGKDAKASVPALFRLISVEEDQSFATAAIREIDVAPAAAIPMLVEALESDNYRSEFYAIYLLGKIGKEAKEVLPKLQEKMRSASRSRRSSSLKKYLSQAIESIESDEKN